MLKTYEPSNTRDTLTVGAVKPLMERDAPIYLIVNGKQHILESVVFRDKNIYFIGGIEIE